MRPTPLLLASLCALACAAALTASPASAARSYESQITEADGAHFNHPFGLAVDGPEDLWVSDAQFQGTVSKFNSSGAYEAQTPSPTPWSTNGNLDGLAFSEAAGEVFVSDSTQDDVWGLEPSAAYSGMDFFGGAWDPSHFGCCSIRVAADNSGGEADGDLYVSNESSVSRIHGSGVDAGDADNFSAGSNAGTNKLTGPFSSANGVAVGPNGDLYVAAANKVYIFEASGAKIGEITEFEGSALGSITAIAIDPSNEDVLLAESEAIEELSSAGQSLEKITEANGASFGSINGLAVGSAGALYVADSGRGVVDVFGSNAILPKVTYGAVTNQTRTSGTLNASIDLGGGPDVTSCEFQYGTNTSYASSLACSPAPPYASNTSVSAHLSGLTTETAYHYRLVLVTANGTRRGAVQTFTPHAVVGVSTDPATDVTASSATMNASFEGEDEDVQYYFEWGPDSSFGNKTPAPPGTRISTPTGPQSVGVGLSGLQPATTYHYRFVASNSFGITYGSERTFTTLGQYQFSTDFGSTGPGDGQFENPSDVAVDGSNGDLYVADTGNHRVVKLDPAGDFIAAWGWGVGGGSAYEVCTSGCQAGVAGASPGQFEAPTFVEVDNSSGPSRGDVYVGDTERGDVQKFDSSGALFESWGEGGAIDFNGDGPIEGITVDNDGNLFVASPGHWTEVGQDGVFRAKITTTFPTKYTLCCPNGRGIDVNSIGSFYQASEGGVSIAPTGELGDSIERFFEGPNPAGDPTGLGVDRSNGDLYVAHGTFLYQFPPSCPPGGAPGTGVTCPPSDTFGSGQLNGALGLALDPSSKILYTANSGDGDIVVFSPLPVPDVTTAPATQTSPTSGTLHGHIGPLGPGAISDCYFEYGTAPGLDFGTVPCEQATPFSGEADVSAEVTGLTPLTSYRFRLVAALSDGERFLSYGRELTFTPNPSTPPSIASTSASAITQTTASLHASINPNLAPTTYVFQYGTSADYGSNTLPGESIGEDGIAHSVSVPIEGLVPNTTYHYRAIAINFSGTTPSPDQTFTTSADGSSTAAAVAVPAAAQGPSSGGGSCTRLSRETRRSNLGAKALLRRARLSRDAGNARALRRRAGRLAKRARRLSRQAGQCAATDGRGTR